MSYIKVSIVETGRNSLKDSPHIFNTESKNFKALEEAKEYIRERYGKIPKGRNKTYIDTTDGQVKEVGFTYSYWNTDYTTRWFQTDWIEITEVTEKPISLFS